MQNLKIKKNDPQMYFQPYLHLRSCTEASHFDHIHVLIWSQMTTTICSQNLICPYNAFFSFFKYWLYQPTFKFIHLYIVIIPTKFHDHATCYSKKMQISYYNLIRILYNIFGQNSCAVWGGEVWALHLSKYHKYRTYLSRENLSHQKINKLGKLGT